MAVVSWLQLKEERWRRQENLYHRCRLDALRNDLEVDRATVDLRITELRADGGYDAAILELRLAYYRLGLALDHVARALEGIER